jgi:predicted ATPase
VDNFRCLENFELDLDDTNVFLGRNGTGKTSVLNVLKNIQSLVVRGSKVDAVFPARDISLYGQRNEQRFEIETRVNEEVYHYSLIVEHDLSRGMMRVGKETLEHDGNPIFEFENGNAQLYHDDYSQGPSYPFDWSQSGIGFLNERADNRKLTQFKKEIANYIIVSCGPPIMSAETRTEDEFLEPLMQNFVGWYRRTAQENMRSIVSLFETLSEALPGFDSINLTESGENSRALKAIFRGPSSEPIRYGFDQLSDGQRALITLYSLLHLSADHRVSLFVDEPENYLALGEIQPWLAEAAERAGESLGQLVVVSHHPVIIDYMAGANGRWFFRDEDGPVRVSKEPKNIVEGLSLSEIIARRWE